jgi:hypothetical protein
LANRIAFLTTPIDLAHEAEPLRLGQKLSGRDEVSSLALHAHKQLLVGDLTRLEVKDRLSMQ